MRNGARTGDSPKLVVTDSQAFREVDQLVPRDVRLTSFSILFARHKGDFRRLLDGARALKRLQPGDQVLIAEACTHHPVQDDIGKVKIPRLLREFVGGELDFRWCRGNDFPDDLGAFKVVVHCGACMLNSKAMLSRIAEASSAGVPMTNYGMAIAACLGILERAVEPILEKEGWFE